MALCHILYLCICVFVYLGSQSGTKGLPSINHTKIYLTDILCPRSASIGVKKHFQEIHIQKIHSQILHLENKLVKNTVSEIHMSSL